MEIDGDGMLDILSGSYSRQDEDMAGIFQVLRGAKDRTWQKPEPLLGSDGQPLILPKAPQGGDDDGVIDRICTRPFACDLDGDGKLDIVAGNFRGTFGWFRGEGPGKFAPKAEWLQAAGREMAVPSHGDPFLVDHDGDGDLDLFTGSAQGGVFLFPNGGTKQRPEFGERITLLEATPHEVVTGETVHFGDAHLKAPGGDTRVWVADVDGDGKLDLLVGDQQRLLHLVEGTDEKTARTKFTAWQQKQAAFFAQPQGEGDAAMKQWQETYQALEKERSAFATEESTGFVWLLRGK